MLTELEKTKRALAGKHRAIDDWLDARQALLYLSLNSSANSVQARIWG